MTTRPTVRRMTSWQGSRRTVVKGALGAAGGALTAGTALKAGIAGAQEASPVASPAASPAAAGAGPHLLVADPTVSAIYVYAVPGFELTGQLDGVGLAAHGGTFQLEDGRLYFGDTAEESVVELTISEAGLPEITRRAPATLGGGVSWMSADPSLAYLAVGSLADDETTQHLTIVDLASFESTVLEFAMAEPEEVHGWLLGDPLHLHVAIGGQIDSYLLADLLAGDAEPVGSVAVELGSHGGATDARNQRVVMAADAGTGFEVLDTADGPAAYAAQIPWDVDGLAGGRNARARMLRDGVHIFGVLTPALDDPTAWAEAQVSNHVTNLDDLTAVRLPVAVGIVGGRWGLADALALWAGYDADGARAYVVDADPASDTFGTATRTIDVSMPSNAATPGEDPADAERSLVTAVTPDGAHGFVTIPGDGLIQVLDLALGTVMADIAVPSPLAGGGYTTVVQAGIAPVDLWGR